MGTVLDLIEKIRERPGIMLGRPSASSLYLFLSGFAYARKDCQLGDFDFLGPFNQFVHDRLRITSTQSWAKIIEFFSTSEAEEMTLFWKLLDEFLALDKSTTKSKRKANLKNGT